MKSKTWSADFDLSKPMVWPKLGKIKYCKPDISDFDLSMIELAPDEEVKSGYIGSKKLTKKQIKAINERLSNKMEPDRTVEIALHKLSEAFDAFVGACLDGDKPKAPDYKAMMKARGYLPPYCKHALSKKR